MSSEKIVSKEHAAWVRYGVALLSVVLALVLRGSLNPVLENHLGFLTLFGAVGFSVWFGRWKPGVLAAIAGYAGADYLFFPHSLPNGAAIAALGGYCVSTGVIILLGELMHRARDRANVEIAKRLEAQLAEAREKELITTTLASIGDAVIATDAQGRVNFLNREAEKLTRWKNDEAMGKPLLDVFRIINERTRQPAENPVEKVFRSGHVVGLANHTVLIAKDGTELPIDDSAAPIRHADGTLSGVILVFRDYTEQKKSIESKARLAAIVESSGDAIFTKNLDGVITSWNASCRRLFGYNVEEIVGKHVTTLFPPDRLNEEDYILKNLRQGLPVERLETVRVAKDGRKIPVLLSVSPMRDSEGHIIGASKIVHDITDLVAAREALRSEKDLLQITLASIGDAVIATDLQGNISFLNPEAERLTRWTNADALGKPLPEVFRIINEHTRHHLENPVEKVFRTGNTVGLANHTVLIAKDGTEIPIDDSAAPIRHADGTFSGVILVFRDFSEQKKSHEAKAHLAAIVEYSGDAIFTKDLNGMITSWNASCQRLFGYHAGEIVGRPVTALFPPDRLKEEDAILASLREGRPVERLETIRVAKGGRKIPVSLSISPIKDPQGQIIGASKIVHDITDLVAAREALRGAHEQLASRAVHLEQLVQQRTARLNEMVGDLEGFSYSIVHDMRGPLRAMNSFTQLLQEECGQVSPTAENYMKRIRTATSRMDRLIQDGLNYSRLMRAELPLVPVDAAALLHGIVETYPTLQPPHAEIEFVGIFPRVKANEATLTQCVSNLLGNAVKFVAPSVVPHVRVWAEPHNDRVRLLFKDNGIGIPISAHERIFQIFQRLDNAYEGTGIGLAIVKKAAERMGGSVGLESEPGKGSTFWLELPRADFAETGVGNACPSHQPND